MASWVYKYELDGVPLYIGKHTGATLSSRLNAHGRKGDNIDPKYWDRLKASKIYFFKCANSIMADVVESELIRRHKPLANIAKKGHWKGLDFPDIAWEEYALDDRAEKTGAKRLKQHEYIHKKNREMEECVKLNYAAADAYNFFYTHPDLKQTETDYVSVEMDDRFIEQCSLQLGLPFETPSTKEDYRRFAVSLFHCFCTRLEFVSGTIGVNANVHLFVDDDNKMELAFESRAMLEKSLKETRCVAKQYEEYYRSVLRQEGQTARKRVQIACDFCEEDCRYAMRRRVSKTYC